VTLHRASSMFSAALQFNDDYLGYHAELPGKIDCTAKLIFLRQMITAMKQANSSVIAVAC